jgi:pimeloyl-ACP methyl ester carboxylesterase
LKRKEREENLMKLNNSYLILLVFSVLLSACSGVRYADAPPLPFDEIDYGFDVQTTDLNPEIAFIDEGEGDKTILLVHGLASNAGFWRYNIAELSKNNRVIAVDLPGYGKSEKGDYPYGMKFYADVLAQFIQDQNLENVHYVGHSMGGQIGITLALRHPEVIDELILAAPAGIEKFDRGEGEWLANVLTMRGVRLAPEPTVRDNLSMNFYRWDNEYEWMVEERVRMAKDDDTMKEFSYTVIQSIKAMIDEPTTHRLDDLTVPTHIIYGKFDGMIPNRSLNPGFTADVFEFGHKTIPNSTLTEIDNGGHMIMIEQPEAFNKAVLEKVR